MEEAEGLEGRLIGDNSSVEQVTAEENGIEVVELDPDIPVSVEISEDKLSATVILNPGAISQKIDIEMIKSALSEKKVIYGLDEEAINSLAETQSIDRTLVAQGREPVDGQDAIIKLLFTEQEKSSPKILDDGSVDLRDITQISNVDAGQKLIEKTPPVQGSPGMNVSGVEVAPKRPKDVKLIAGKNCQLSEDGLEVLATAAGRPVFRNNKIRVDPVYVVSGNVDYSTGNIDFVGSVVVKGWVRDGFTVSAAGDIEVQQGVDGAYLNAGGNISVRFGIQGGDKGKIAAKGNVKAAYISSALVFAGNDVLVRESIMHSKVYADKRVVVEGGHGLIVGGLARAGELISAKTIGSGLAQPTSIEVGLNPAIREEIIQLDEAIATKLKSLDQTVKAVNLLDNLKTQLRRLPPDKEKLLIKLKVAMRQLQDEVNESKERKLHIEEQLEKVKNPRIRVIRQLHPGVRILIRGCNLNVNDTLNNVVLYEKDREIVMGPYK